MRLLLRTVLLSALAVGVLWGQCKLIKNPKTHQWDCISPAGSGSGDVTGPGSSTDNAVVRFDSTTGKIIQNSGVIIDDSNNVSGIGTLARTSYDIHTAIAAPGTPAAGLGRTWIDSTTKAFTAKDDAGNVTQTWSLGTCLTSVGNQALVDTALCAALAVANNYTAKQSHTKTGNISAFRLVPSIAPTTTLTEGDFYFDSTLHALETYSGSAWQPYTTNPMTTSQDIIVAGASGVPCWLAIGGSLTYLAVVSGSLAYRSPIFSDIGSTIATAQLASASVTPVKMAASTFDAQSDGATITWPIASVLNAQATVTLGGNRTLNITNPVVGGNYVFKITQDGTGSRTLTKGTGCTFRELGNSAATFGLSTAAGTVDVLTFTYDGTNCYATVGKDYK